MALPRQLALPRRLGGTLFGAPTDRIHAVQTTICVTDLAPKPGEHILEIRFGAGTCLAALLRAAPDVRGAGANPSQTMLTAAARRTRRHGDRIRLHQTAAAQLP